MIYLFLFLSIVVDLDNGIFNSSVKYIMKDLIKKKIILTIDNITIEIIITIKEINIIIKKTIIRHLIEENMIHMIYMKKKFHMTKKPQYQLRHLL